MRTVRDHEHLLLADTPEQFVSAVGELLNDDALCRKLQTNSRSLVEQNYSTPGLAMRLAKAYVSVVEWRRS